MIARRTAIQISFHAWSALVEMQVSPRTKSRRVRLWPAAIEWAVDFRRWPIVSVIALQRQVRSWGRTGSDRHIAKVTRLTRSGHWLPQNRLPIAAGEASLPMFPSRKSPQLQALSLVSITRGGLTVLRLTAVGCGSAGSPARRWLELLPKIIIDFQSARFISFHAELPQSEGLERHIAMPVVFHK